MTAATGRNGNIRTPFVPGALDDAGLSPQEFRVLCHLWRRRPHGKDQPSQKSIAAVCRMKRETVREVTKALERSQWIRVDRGSSFRNHNRYTLLDGPETGQLKMNLDDPQTGMQMTPKRACSGPPNGSSLLKGIPLKGIPLKEESGVTFPDGLKTTEFQELFFKWMDHRRGCRKPKRSWADFFNEQLNWLAKLGPEQATRIVETSLVNGYIGLIPPERKTHDRTTKTRSGYRAHNPPAQDRSRARGYTSV